MQNGNVEDAENARLDALAEHDLIGIAPDPTLTHVVALAARLFAVPTAFVSLVGRDRQIFHAKIGLDLCETNREVAFCAHTITGDDALVVLDATRDPRFCDNPLVTGPPYIRFYAGIPLRTPGGHAIGTLCLADTHPRSGVSETDLRNLRDLSHLVLDQLALRRMDVARRASQSRFEQIAGTSPDGIVCADQNGRITFWNGAAERLFGYSVEEAQGREIDLIVPERMRGGHGGGLQRVARGGTPRLVGKLVELSARHKDGTEFPIELSLSMWMEAEGAAFGAIVRDVRQRRANEERLYRLAHLDPLTALPNRTVLHDRISTAIQNGSSASVLMVDVDGFKAVNDTLGHAAGDAVLREVSRRLLACADPGDTVSRLGGDEFALLLPGIGDPLKSTLTADAIVHALLEPIQIEGQALRLGASVGIAIAPSHGEDANALLGSADMALYRAKLDGRRRSSLYTQDLREAAARDKRCRDDLDGAVERGEFVLLYQPQVRLKDGALVGAEALIRWQHPQHGLLAPAAFLGTLEAGPHAAQVGDWVLRTACAQARTWREAGQSEFQIGVNLSASQFRGGKLASRVRDTLTETGLPASALELEITETIILNNDLDTITHLRQIRSMGAGVAFDDYGTGYASLSLLKRFPLTRLKIDRSFVTGKGSSREDLTIICAILRLGRGFGLNVIAEGIETEAECERLRAKGCKEGQGYLFGKPMTADNFGLRFGIIKLNGSQNAHMAA